MSKGIVLIRAFILRQAQDERNHGGGRRVAPFCFRWLKGEAAFRFKTGLPGSGNTATVRCNIKCIENQWIDGPDGRLLKIMERKSI